MSRDRYLHFSQFFFLIGIESVGFPLFSRSNISEIEVLYKHYRIYCILELLTSIN